MKETNICCGVRRPPGPVEPVADARPIGYINRNAPVAQLDRALPSEAGPASHQSLQY
jgi:hypothetical protein